ncbi:MULTISPECIES: hemophore-related protein [unclassified Mycobacterium]|uniref:hemophore-related protein n=1 Tax=unclassified Mycobacterium TaxID=2642494 RepID=UPI001561146E|nr:MULTISPECIES: hemophore-related protein [unclassified Mycobacterium]
MIKLSLSKMAVGFGGLALALTAGAGVASAQPNLDSAVNTTCSYQQLEAAANAADPSMASKLSSDPMLQAGVRQFLAAPPAQRQMMAQQIASMPANQPYLGLYQQIFDTCQNF